MDVTPIFLLLIVAVITRCRCDLAGFGPTNGNGASRFGELLKPPPPPPLSQIVPVPFHGGGGRNQRQNEDIGHQYQPPPPPPQSAAQIPPSNDFKFPAPFYKQYNFNFVPPPQAFTTTTTPSPSLFQKVSGWLFPSQQTSYDLGSSAYINNKAPIKKDCNPCNLVPWIPVLRYNLGANNAYQNNPTYGPPSPTALTNLQNVVQYQPQPFYLQNGEKNRPQLTSDVHLANYGPPTNTYNSNSIGVSSSTYGPPSPTHTIGFTSQSPPSSTFSIPSSSYGIPSSSYGALSTSISQQSSSYLPTSSQGVSITSYNLPSSTYIPPPSTYVTPLPIYETAHPMTTTFGSVTPNYESAFPQESDIKTFGAIEPFRDLQLPKVSHPIGFKNSYGETISNPYASYNPYPVSATAAESSKIKTEVLPLDPTKLSAENMSLALANPAPFTLNRGRTIHTLQPVALPNLSVSPLPPIFNARPFRPVPVPFPKNVVQSINQMQQTSNIVQSVPLIEYTHSVDYPTTYIQAPIIDIDVSKNINQSKAFRNIPNSFIVDEIRDISSQASEDHISATKSIPDSSFESTGSDVGNDIYDAGIPIDLRQSTIVPPIHKPAFADLRGVKDEDVDKYRTESNLQNIDSPLLYLKPSAPHKSVGNFMLAVSTPVNKNEYEIYDDLPTTATPQLPIPTSGWDESRSDYGQGLSSAPLQKHVYKPKIVQIIVPYISSNKKDKNNNGSPHIPRDWDATIEKEFRARKIPSNTENSFASTITENYSTVSTTTEVPTTTVTESYGSDRSNSATMQNDLYDVKEPPFDIIKLQHTIDDWTEQEYSKHKPLQRTRSNEKYAKQIPDEYFTTTIPSNYVTEISNYNYDFYDHEGSSSIQHWVTNENDNVFNKPHKEYNSIERSKNRHNSEKNDEKDQIQKLHIYTAASSFRTSTTTVTTSTTSTTPAPWGKIQTSISPLTKEKVYVVTSKPWRDTINITKEWFDEERFESKKTNLDTDVPVSDSLPFKSPRFMNRPSFGFTSGGKIESVKSDSSYGFSKSWYQSINELETQAQNNSTSLTEDI